MDAEKIRCQRCGLPCGGGIHREGDFVGTEFHAPMKSILAPAGGFHEAVPDPLALTLHEALTVLRDVVGKCEARGETLGGAYAAAVRVLEKAEGL